LFLLLLLSLLLQLTARQELTRAAGRESDSSSLTGAGPHTQAVNQKRLIQSTTDVEGVAARIRSSLSPSVAPVPSRETDDDDDGDALRRLFVLLAGDRALARWLALTPRSSVLDL